VPRKIFVAGEILTAADVNSNLMDQAVMVFNDAAARTTAIPSPIEGMVTYLKSPKSVQRYNGTAWVSGISGFTKSLTVVSSNASFAPAGFASWSAALGSPIVKVTVIGGGGGGGSIFANTISGSGGTTTVNAGGAGTLSASGGEGGAPFPTTNNTGFNGANAVGSFVSGNGGQGANRRGSGADQGSGTSCGTGGQIVIGYLNLGATTTVDITIGGGGTGGAGTSSTGGLGGSGSVIFEYVEA
jgi:hypothetical protein